MTFLELLRICNKGYQSENQDSSLMDHVDEQGNLLNPPAEGDTLGLFIVRELKDTFDSDVSQTDQFNVAIQMMERARNDVWNVVNELKQYNNTLDWKCLKCNHRGVYEDFVDSHKTEGFSCPKCGNDDESKIQSP